MDGNQKEILSFIARRFKDDSHWLDGNCYYFALILKDRFPGGDICYDVIDGHFLFLFDDCYYDWRGVVAPVGKTVKWDEFEQYDGLQKQRILKGCIQ